MKKMHFLPAILQLFAVAEAFFSLESLFRGEKSAKLENQNRSLNNSGTDFTYCGDVPKHCNETKYRSYDGSCNNLRHGWWGTPFTPYVRLLPCYSYSDGVYELAKGLPNSREVSLRIFADVDIPDPVWTVSFMQFGQLLAHDLSMTAVNSQAGNDELPCCSDGKITLNGKINPRCAPILIPEIDGYNAPEGNKCMNFLRTETTKDVRKCKNATDVAEQLTVVTAYIDVSFLYGSDEKTAKSLRKFKDGRLKSEQRKGREVLTQDPTPTITCNIKDPREPCYKAGDARVNQNPQLALFHNIYLALHNSIAESLAKVNPHWNDEKLYQETRRIVIAQHQHITYYEYLIPLIGRQNMIENKLIYPDAKCHVKDYDPNVNPGISNEFATAADRYFHTQIVGLLKSLEENRNISSFFKLNEWIDRPSICEQGNNFLGLTIGMATQAQGDGDRFLPKDVLHLFSKGNNLLGLDLKATDIMRSRDHGLCPYASTLKHLGLANPNSFDDFKKFIKPEYVEILKDLYNSYKDVDATVGMHLENIVLNTLSGSTVQAIITDQFKRTRTGDSYYYENGNGAHAFTCDQVNEIRRSSSMAGLLCYNKGLRKIQPKAFELISKTNQLKHCSEIPKFNPKAWKEKKIEKTSSPPSSSSSLSSRSNESI